MAAYNVSFQATPPFFDHFFRPSRRKRPLRSKLIRLGFPLSARWHVLTKNALVLLSLNSRPFFSLLPFSKCVSFFLYSCLFFYFDDLKIMILVPVTSSFTFISNFWRWFRRKTSRSSSDRLLATSRHEYDLPQISFFWLHSDSSDYQIVPNKY